jgi:flagellar assembly protein FliH
VTTPYERVLTGRSARVPGDPWGRGARVPGRGIVIELDSAQAAVETPDPGVLAAQQAEAVRVAEARAYEAGRERAEQELASAVMAAGALAHALETAVPRDVDMVARTVAELAVLITRRILGAELRHEPSILVAAIEAGLRQAVGASLIHVELHPSAVDAVEAAWTSRHGTRHRGITWSFASDPTLAPGGCRLRTEHGIVDAGFETQLSEVAGALDAAIPGYIASALGTPVPAPAEPVTGAGGGTGRAHGRPVATQSAEADLRPTADLAVLADLADPATLDVPTGDGLAAAIFDLPAAADLSALALIDVHGPEDEA